VYLEMIAGALLQYCPNMQGASQFAPGTPARGLTAGLDIGTTAVKAVAVDENGRVVQRCSIPSQLEMGTSGQLEHDARRTWWETPRQALAQLIAALPPGAISSVAVSAFMPSIAAVDADGLPIGPGLLYGDSRGRGPDARRGNGQAGGDPTATDELAQLASWSASRAPMAAGFWPAQAVANAALGGEGVLDLASAFAAGTLFGGSGWDPAACRRAGLDVEQLPRVVTFGEAIDKVLIPGAQGWDGGARSRGAASSGARGLGAGGRAAAGVGAEGRDWVAVTSQLHAAVPDDGAGGASSHGAGPAAALEASPGRSEVVLGAGSVDGLCEQLVAGATEDGDVLVSLGSTLVVWLTVPGWPQVSPGLWRVPHTAAGKAMVGGASNAGGIWVDWVDRLLGGSGPASRRPAAGDNGLSAGDDGLSASDYGLSAGDVPVWWPWVRGERVPWHDPALRVGLGEAGLAQGPEALRRGAFEATGFVVRHMLELAALCGTRPERVLVTGGGAYRPAWMQALAEVLGRPVYPATYPQGAARGAAFLARMAIGLESSVNDAARWASWSAPVEPRPAWVEAAAERYRRWLDGLPQHPALTVP
jgi:xylulokinase